MKRVIIHIVLLLTANAAIRTMAQDASTARLRIWSSQQVHITGEDIWVDGDVTGDLKVSKSITIRLIDRNGSMMTEVEVAPRDFGFSAFLTIPENLVSDYYFLDGYVNGSRSLTMVSPVMVINPRIPPAANCKDFTLPTSSPITAGSITILPDRDHVSPRNEVICQLKNATDLKDATISVYRYDGLSRLIDSVSSGFSSTLIHDAKGMAENEGKLVKARATINGKPIEKLSIIAALKGSGAVLATATTHADGVAEFILPVTYDASTLVLSPQGITMQGLSVTIIRDVQNPVSIGFSCLQLRESMRADIEARMLNSRVLNRFYGDGSRSYDVTDRDTSDFYGKPDFRYLLDEYVRFPNMEEVIGEIIPEARVKKEKGERKLQVLNLPGKNFFEEEALVLVDGVPLRDTRKIIDADPLLIRSIEVVARKYFMGNAEYKGIIHFKSYRGDLAGLQLSSGDASVPYQGNQEAARLNATERKSKTDRMPDLRNMLLKENVSADQLKNGFRFYTSDADGEYRILLQGRRKDGSMASGSTMITVNAATTPD